MLRFIKGVRLIIALMQHGTGRFPWQHECLPLLAIHKCNTLLAIFITLKSSIPSLEYPTVMLHPSQRYVS